MTDELEQRVKKLTRETKLLNKKLLRSETNREQAEKMKDETDALYENVLKQVAAQKKAIEDAQEQLKDAFEVITGSITYASRIQRSVLPDEGFLSSIVQDHFILWDPRDNVGGDFYWVSAWGEGYLIILGDCTGHGVPGAFMTLIAIGALERALTETDTGNLGQLIPRIHQFIQTTLSQHCDGGDSDDGLELGAIYFKPEETSMLFVGARFDLFEVNNGKVETVKGTKSGLGYRGISYAQQYEEKIIDLNVGSSFYLTSDGYIDQVGGERRRMFGKKRFRECLLSMQKSSMEEQKQHLIDVLRDFQGAEKRRDDVSLIGLRF